MDWHENLNWVSWNHVKKIYLSHIILLSMIGLTYEFSKSALAQPSTWLTPRTHPPVGFHWVKSWKSVHKHLAATLLGKPLEFFLFFFISTTGRATTRSMSRKPVNDDAAPSTSIEVNSATLQKRLLMSQKASTHLGTWWSKRMIGFASLKSPSTKFSLYSTSSKTKQLVLVRVLNTRACLSHHVKELNTRFFP